MKSKHLAILAVLGLGIITTPARAETLTREIIEKHLQSMVDLYNTVPVDDKAILKFIEDYTVDGAIYRSDIFINGSDVPMVKSMNREQTIRAAKERESNYTKATGRYEILEFTPQNDVSKVDVRYKVWHDGTIEQKLPTNEVGRISFKSIAECSETFTLEGSQVKGLNNNCTVHMAQEKPIHEKIKPEVKKAEPVVSPAPEAPKAAP